MVMNWVCVEAENWFLLELYLVHGHLQWGSGSLWGVNRAGRDVDPLRRSVRSSTISSVHFTAAYAVTVAAIPQRVGLPKMWGCQGDAAIQFSVLGFDLQQIG